MRHERDEFDTLHWVIVIGTIGLVLAGLVEFNARRQAAAMTRELLRPATPEERAQIDAATRAMERDMQIAAWPKHAPDPQAAWETVSRTPPGHRYDTRPLADNERCIGHQRFQHIGTAWTEIGSCE